MSDGVDGKAWHFNGIYGHLEEHNKRKTWTLLRDLAERMGDRIVCFGDFNDVVLEREKRSGNNRTASQLALGRQTLDVRGLIDNEFFGHHLTWSNRRRGEDNIQCRLDKCESSLQSKFIIFLVMGQTIP